MSVIQGGVIPGAGSGATGAERSLRFRAAASAYLSRTGVAPTDQAKWSWSGWVKRGALGSIGYLASTGTGASDTTRLEFGFQSDNTFQVIGGTTEFRRSNRVFRDPSEVGHLLVVVDTTQVTASLRCRVYWNNEELTWSVNNTLTTCGFNTAAATRIGLLVAGLYPFDGYLTEVNFIDGQALDPSYFGQNDSNGIWVPKSYSGTYGNNGFYLNFRDASNLTNLCADQSGRGNNWTASGISLTAGATYDSMYDYPVNGASGTQPVGCYATLNTLNPSRSTITNGNLTASGATDFPTIVPTSGTWYFEIDGVSKTWTPPAAFPAAAGNYNFGQRPFTNTPTNPCLCTANLPSDAVITSGSFTGNATADGPVFYAKGNPTALTINGNAVTFGTHADKLATGFKLRTASASYNASGTNTFTLTAGDKIANNNRAQGNP